MSRPPRVLVSGYYGFANTGDEAILAGLKEGFRRLELDVQLTVLSGGPQATEAEHGVRAVSRGIVSAHRELRRSDLLVSGGGGLLQDATSWRSPLYYLGVIRLALAAKVPVACLGYGIGPLRRAASRWLTKRCLARAEVLAVRDTLSLETLREVGLLRDVEVTADFAFLLPAPSADDIARAWARSGLHQDDPPRLGIALRRPPGTLQAGLPDRLAAALQPACEQLQLRPTLVPMQRPADVDFAEHVARAMSTPVDIVRSALSARETLAVMAGFDLVVAMRLHAAIFAAISRVPFVAVSYDPKVDGLMRELGTQTAVSTEVFEPEALGRAICAAWTERDSTVARVVTRLDGLRTRALRNIELVRPLLSASGP